MTDPVRVVVDLTGGAIHGITADGAVRIVFIDSDLDGTDEDAPRIELPNGALAATWVHEVDPGWKANGEFDEQYVEAVHAAAGYTEA